MVTSAAALISSRGVNATSFSDVLADSGSPRGSIYHHFPEGKDQLAQEAVRLVAEAVLSRQRATQATTATGVLNSFVGLWRGVVVASNGAAGCAIAGTAVDTTPEDERLLDVVRASFESWIELLAQQFRDVGVPAKRARPIAVATVAGLEGALILCRAEQDVGPLDTVAGELARLLP